MCDYFSLAYVFSLFFASHRSSNFVDIPIKTMIWAFLYLRNRVFVKVLLKKKKKTKKSLCRSLIIFIMLGLCNWLRQLKNSSFVLLIIHFSYISFDMLFPSNVFDVPGCSVCFYWFWCLATFQGICCSKFGI